MDAPAGERLSCQRRVRATDERIGINPLAAGRCAASSVARRHPQITAHA